MGCTLQESWMLKHEMQQSFQRLESFWWYWAAADKGRKFLFEDYLPQGPPPIGMGRPTGRILGGGAPANRGPF